MSVRAPVGPVNVTDRKIVIGRGPCAIYPKEDIKQKFLLHPSFVTRFLDELWDGNNCKEHKQNQIQNFEIPVPPLEIQQEIVDEIEGYQKIIDGCRQVVQNYKPTIDIDPSWEMVELKNLYEANLDSKRVPITKGDRKAGEIPYYGASGIVDYVEGYLFDEDLLLISEDGANLKDRNYPIAFSISGKNWVNNHAHVMRFNDRISQNM